MAIANDNVITRMFQGRIGNVIFRPGRGMPGFDILVSLGVQILFVTPKKGCMMVGYRYVNAKRRESRKKGAGRAQEPYSKL